MKRMGFTLIELAAVTAIGTLVAATLAPGVRAARLSARGQSSASNLAQIGQGSEMYALDNQGRIFSYTWQAGETYIMPDGTPRVPVSDEHAASLQNEEILQRRTGRLSGVTKIKSFGLRLAHRRYRHLVLMDYLDRPFPDSLFADPADANLLQWQTNPEDVSAANNIPYAPGSDTTGYDGTSENGTSWSDVAVRQRWPFSSSYQSTASAWQPDGLDGEPVYVPIPQTPHVYAWSDAVRLSEGRRYTEVVFPSAKVHLHEEFDREQAGSPYFAYDHARPEKLMFDGSVNSFNSGDATPSWNPHMGKQVWVQRYVPLHTFPIPLGGLGNGNEPPLNMRYRWTFGGLTGVDYPQPLMRR